MNELMKLGIERLRDTYPNRKIEPVMALYRGGAFRCSFYVNNRSAYGIGASMNECCDSMIAAIREADECGLEKELFEI
ncbi:MAG: hypothetical protein LBT50_06475 [Prevotellaceae bacterium]|jgi:hypothetical protein|nr:hypothetical protein [Prevotellaceae bacterium]